MYKTGHTACVPQHSQGRQRAAQASDLRVLRTEATTVRPMCHFPISLVRVRTSDE